MIGWRGAEHHFLDLLKTIRSKATPTLVVGASDEGTQETVTHLATAGLAEDVMMRFTGGFGGFLETDELESFLYPSVTELRARFGELYGST